MTPEIAQAIDRVKSLKFPPEKRYEREMRFLTELRTVGLSIATDPPLPASSPIIPATPAELHDLATWSNLRANHLLALAEAREFSPLNYRWRVSKMFHERISIELRRYADTAP